MMDPNYDPYEELEFCKQSIRDLAQAIEALVEANNLQGRALQNCERKISIQKNQITSIINSLKENNCGKTSDNNTNR